MPAPKKPISPSQTPRGQKLVAAAQRIYGKEMGVKNIREAIDAFYGSTKLLPSIIEIWVVNEKLQSVRKGRDFARSNAEAKQLSALAKAAAAERKRKGQRLTKNEVELVERLVRMTRLNAPMPPGQKRLGKYDEAVLEHQLAEMARSQTGRPKPVRKGPRRRAWHLP